MLFLLLLVTNFLYDGSAVPDRGFFGLENFMSRTRSFVEYSLLMVISDETVPDGVVTQSDTVAVTTVLLRSLMDTRPSSLGFGEATLVTVVVVLLDTDVFAEDDTSGLEDLLQTSTVLDVDTVVVVVVTSVTTVCIFASPFTMSLGKPFCSMESLLRLDSSAEDTGDEALF